jgi:hypothetical protein
MPETHTTGLYSDSKTGSHLVKFSCMANCDLENKGKLVEIYQNKAIYHLFVCTNIRTLASLVDLIHDLQSPTLNEPVFVLVPSFASFAFITACILLGVLPTRFL